MKEDYRRKDNEGRISEEASGSIRGYLGDIWEASGRHLGGIWEAFGRHLGGIWEASGRHLRGI